MVDDDYVTRAREAAALVWNGLNALKAMQRKWLALDYTANLEEATEGSNVGITPLELSDVIFTTTDAIETLFESGHGTNIAKILP